MSDLLPIIKQDCDYKKMLQNYFKNFIETY